MKRNPAPLRIQFHGVRGSRPTHHVGLLQTGGNSTCIEIKTGFDFQLFIDCGSGLLHRKSTPQTQAGSKRYHILITHTHWDHILGIPFFAPLFDPEATITFYASNGSNGTFPELFKRLFTPGHLPYPAKALQAKIQFVTIVPDVPFLVDGHVRVDSIQTNHTAVTLGFKITCGSSSVAVVTDTAPLYPDNLLGDGMLERAEVIGTNAFLTEYQNKMKEFLSGISTLVCDTHFNNQNIKPDWGHSTPDLAIDLCIAGGVPRLLMFHHAPEDLDKQVQEKVRAIATRASQAGVLVDNAREGDEWILKSA